MPVSYPIPPWLVPASPEQLAGLQLSAQAKGAELAMQRQRLAQESQMAEMRLAAQREEANRDALRQQQQMEISNAYHQATLGLRKAELDQEQQKLNFTIQTMGQKMQAQRDIQTEAADLIAGGMPEEEAYIKANLRHAAQLGMSGGGIASLARARPGITAPKQIGETPGYTMWQVPGPTGTTTKFLPKRSGMSPEQRFVTSQRVRMIQKRLSELEKEESLNQQALSVLKEKNPRRKVLSEQSARNQSEIAKLKEQLDQLLPMPEKATAEPTEEEAPAAEQTMEDEGD